MATFRGAGSLPGRHGRSFKRKGGGYFGYFGSFRPSKAGPERRSRRERERLLLAPLATFRSGTRSGRLGRTCQQELLEPAWARDAPSWTNTQAPCSKPRKTAPRAVPGRLAMRPWRRRQGSRMERRPLRPRAWWPTLPCQRQKVAKVAMCRPSPPETAKAPAPCRSSGPSESGIRVWGLGSDSLPGEGG